MSHRRKPVPCIVCEDETYDTQSLCGGCRSLIEDGKSFRKLQGAFAKGDLERSGSFQRWYMYHHQGNAKSHLNNEQNFQDGVLALAHAQHEYKYRAPHAWQELTPSKVIIGGDSHSNFNGPDYITVTEKGQGEIMRQVYQAAVNLMAEAYEEGKQDGSSLLLKLANGEVSMDDMIDIEARPSKRGKKR